MCQLRDQRRLNVQIEGGDDDHGEKVEASPRNDGEEEEGRGYKGKVVKRLFGWKKRNTPSIKKAAAVHISDADQLNAPYIGGKK